MLKVRAFAAAGSSATDSEVSPSNNRLEAYQELDAGLSGLAKMETSLLRTLASSRILDVLAAQKGTLLIEVSEDMHYREKILEQIRKTNELGHIISVTLSYMQKALRSDEFHATCEASAYLQVQSEGVEDYLNQFCRERIEERGKILKALENPEWDFRTLEGIAKETGLDGNKVKEILEENPEQFQKLPFADRLGRGLYKSADRPIGWRERLAALQSALKY